MEKKVQLPAIGLIVTAALAVLTGLVSLFANTWMLSFAEQMQMPPDAIERMRAMNQGGWVMSLLSMVLNLGGSIVIALGGWQMMKLKSWGLALTASILAMIPCFSGCCCLIGLPIGIWSLIVLLDKDVKAAFGSPTPPPMP